MVPARKKKRGRLERRPTELEEFETLAHGEKYLLAGIPRLRTLFEVIRQILLQSVWIS